MYLSDRSIHLLALGVGVFAVFNLFTQIYVISAVGIALFACIAVKLIQDLGKRLDIRDLISFMSILQWIVGPVMAYNVLPYDELYYMAVSEEEYMNYMVPLCFFMVLGLYLPLKDNRIINQDDMTRVKHYVKANPWLGYILIAVGLGAGFVSKSLPSSLTFVMFLITNMQYVGLFLILFSGSKFRWLIFAGIMGLSTFAAVMQGMFGELVQWFTLAFLVIAMTVRFPVWAKILLILIGSVAISLVQSTKEEYRLATWYATSDKSNAEIYREIILSRLSSPSLLFDQGTTENMGARLNQGWIIARIMNHMPEKLPFVRGETVETALYASLLPRFLAPGKARAGGRANFERFTGTPLPETTSMDISLAGEGYANFGRFGGMIFIFLVSLMYNWVIVKVISISRKEPSLLLWIPYLFFMVMKAETDFATVFNYLTKAVLMTFLAFYVMHVVQSFRQKKPRISILPAKS